MESKTKELVKAGHELVVLLGNQHGMLDAASLVQRLTAQLDITAVVLREKSKQCDASEQAERVWETTMMQACGEDGPKSVADKFASLEARCAELAAENAALKSAFKPEVIPEEAVNAFMDTAILDHDWNDTGEWSWVENETDVIRAVLDALVKPETPTTDAWQREQRQKAWAEGINYTAGRLAAAFNHGCVNKPMAEVGDIVRMILTTKDDLANDPGPAPDGLSGEYAEKALEDWEQQLRNGESV